MSIGVDLITAERERQIQKGYTPERDRGKYEVNPYYLVETAIQLLARKHSWQLATKVGFNDLTAQILTKHRNNPDKILVIVGALIAAELDTRQRTPEEFWRVSCYTSPEAKALHIGTEDYFTAVAAAHAVQAAKAAGQHVEVKHFKEQL